MTDETGKFFFYVRHAWLALLLAMLAGCAQMKPSPDEYRGDAGTSQPAGEAVSLLYYFDYARGLSATELARETERARLLQLHNKSDFHALQYAMLLSLPGGDTRRAQQLLDPLIRDGGGQSRELKALALLMATDLAERRRLEDGVRRADDLEKKLEALKNIEKSLIQRDPTDPGEKK